MTERYLPVPVWNNMIGRWEPVDFRNGQKVVPWPKQVDLTALVVPEYRDGNRVQFIRDETCAREGVIHMVMLRGGVYGPFDSITDLLQRWYYHQDAISYIVTARGHDHILKANAILGRFLSPSEVAYWRITKML